MSRDELVVLHCLTVELLLKNGATKRISVDITLDQLANISNQFTRDPDLVYDAIKNDIEKGITTLKHEVRLSINNETKDNVIYVHNTMFDGREVVCMTIRGVASGWDIDECLAEHELYTKNYKRRQ